MGISWPPIWSDFGGAKRSQFLEFNHLPVAASPTRSLLESRGGLGWPRGLAQLLSPFPSKCCYYPTPVKTNDRYSIEMTDKTRFIATPNQYSTHSCSLYYEVLRGCSCISRLVPRPPGHPKTQTHVPATGTFRHGQGLKE